MPTALDQETAQRRRAAIAMLLQGSSGEPIQSWTQGVNRIAQGLLGGYQSGQLNREAEERRLKTEADEAADARALMGAPGLGGPVGNAPAGSRSPVADALGGGEVPSTVAMPQPIAARGQPEPDIPGPHQQRGVINGNLSDSPMLGMSVDGQPVQTASLAPGMGGPPVMSGMSPAGAIPVQTESFRPPVPPPSMGAPVAPGPQVAQALGPAPGLPAQRTQMGIPPDMQEYIQRLLARKGTREQGKALYGQFAKPQDVEQPGQKLTDDIREYNAAKAQGYKGSLLDFITATKSAGATKLTVDQRAESSYEVANAKSFAELNHAIPKAAADARGKISSLTRLGQLLSDPNIHTGAGASLMLDLKRVAKSAGIDVGDLGGPEAVRSIQNAFALELRNPSGGAGMPGALSDKDREFLQSIPPGLERTPEGNKAIGEYLTKMSQRSLQIERLRQDYVKQNKRLDDGFYAVVADFADKNPLFEAIEKPAAPVETKTIGGKSYYKKDNKWFEGSP